MRILDRGGVVLAVVLAGAMNAGAQGVPADEQHFGFDALLEQPATQSSFTIDRSMLSATDGFVGNDPETRRVVAGLNSITIHNYRFREDAAYSHAAFGAVEDNFRAGHWKHLVNTNANSAVQTDVWMRFEGADIRQVVVLNRGRRDMNFVSVDCHLRPLDLVHLSGHFGIPKVNEDAVMAPAP